MDRPELIFQDADTEFVKDEFYEDFQAPKFYDFCVPHQSVDADTWFGMSSPQAGAPHAVLETTQEQEVEDEAETSAAPTLPVSLAAGPKVAEATTLHSQAEEDLSGLFEKLLNCNSKEQLKLNKIEDSQGENLPDGSHIKEPDHNPSAPSYPAKVTREKKQVLPRNEGAAVAKVELATLSNPKQQGRKKRNISQAVQSGNTASDSSLLGKMKTMPSSVQRIDSTAEHVSTSCTSASSLRLQHGCFLRQHKKLKTTCPRPFRLLTEERGALKEIEFNKKMEQYLLEKEKIQPASSFSAVSHVVWGAAKPPISVAKDQSKDQRPTSEKSTRLAEAVGARTQAEKRLLELKQGKETVLQMPKMEDEALSEVKDGKCNKKLQIKRLKDLGSKRQEAQTKTKESAKLLEANENVERGALKEIKYNKKSDNCVGGPGGEHVFHSVSSGEAPQVTKTTQATAHKHGKEDRAMTKPSVAHTLKVTGDFFFQAQRSLKKLTIPRAPKLHLPRCKREFGGSKLVLIEQV